MPESPYDQESRWHTATDDGLAQIIGTLENDFYIRYQIKDEGYIFASKILCDWWRRYYAF